MSIKMPTYTVTKENNFKELEKYIQDRSGIYTELDTQNFPCFMTQPSSGSPPSRPGLGTIHRASALPWIIQEKPNAFLKQGTASTWVPVWDKRDCMWFWQVMFPILILIFLIHITEASCSQGSHFPSSLFSSSHQYYRMAFMLMGFLGIPPGFYNERNFGIFTLMSND